jgi:hypothetical protein
VSTYSLLRRTTVVSTVAADDVRAAIRHWQALGLVPAARWEGVSSDGKVCGWLCSMTFGNGAPLIAMETPCERCGGTEIDPDCGGIGNDCGECTHGNAPDRAGLGADLDVVIGPDGDGDTYDGVSVEPVVDDITHDQFLDDLVVTFVEGGVYSWFNVKDYRCPEGGPTTGKVRLNRSEECDAADCPLHGEHPAQREQRRVCSSNGPWVPLNAALMQKGIDRIKAGPVEGLAESYRARLIGCDATHDAGDLDINDVDVIMQVAMLDEVTYA